MSGGRRDGFASLMSGKRWKARCLQYVLLVSCIISEVLLLPTLAFLAARSQNERETNADVVFVQPRLVRRRSQVMLGKEHLPPGDLQGGADAPETFRCESSFSDNSTWEIPTELTGHPYHQVRAPGTGEWTRLPGPEPMVRSAAWLQGATKQETVSRKIVSRASKGQSMLLHIR